MTDGQLPYKAEFSLDNLGNIAGDIKSYGLIKVVLAAIALALHWLFESRVEALVVVTVLIFLDTVTGVIKAAKAGNLSSGGFFRFALKCMVYFILMATAALVDKVMPIPFASIIMITFLAATEAISVMENLGAAGYAVPTSLINRLRSFSSKPKDK